MENVVHPLLMDLIVEMVFSNLETKEIHKLRLVNQLWNKIAVKLLTPHSLVKIWENADAILWMDAFNSKTDFNLVPRRFLFSSMFLANVHHLHNDLQNEFFGKALFIKTFMGFHQKAIKTFFKIVLCKCTELVSLDIEIPGVIVERFTGVSYQLEKVKSLRLSRPANYGSTFTDTNLKAIVNMLTCIQSLEVGKSYAQRNILSLMDRKKTFTQIVKLELHAISKDYEFNILTRWLAKDVRLQFFSISILNYESTDGLFGFLEMINQQANLKVLKIFFPHKFQFINLPTVSSLKFGGLQIFEGEPWFSFQNMSNFRLKKLNIARLNYVDFRKVNFALPIIPEGESGPKIRAKELTCPNMVFNSDQLERLQCYFEGVECLDITLIAEEDLFSKLWASTWRKSVIVLRLTVRCGKVRSKENPFDVRKAFAGPKKDLGIQQFTKMGNLLVDFVETAPVDVDLYLSVLKNFLDNFPHLKYKLRGEKCTFQLHVVKDESMID